MKNKSYKLIFMFLSFACFANAVTYYVRPDGNDENDGLSPQTALLTVRTALDKAIVDDDVINISGTVNFHKDVVSLKSITKSITIQGDNKITAVVVGTTTNGLRSMEIGTESSMPNVVIENLTFKDFNAAGVTGGGVIDYTQGTFTCRNVIFENNTARWGGAIEIRVPYFTEVANKVFIQDCYFKGNKALKIESNEVARGGAIYVYPSPTLYPNPLELTIERCTFDSNISEYDGSALYIMMGTSEEVNKVIVQNCTFVNNVNKNGGVHPTHKTANLAAIYVRGIGEGAHNGEIKFINNTIAYNSNEKNGGHPGFHNGGYPNLTMINNLFFENTHAGGNYSFRTTADMVESRNNIADVVYSVAEGFNKAAGSSSNIENATSEQLKLDESIADNGGETPTLALNAGSIALNSGYITGAPMLDQRGFPREGNPDVGAFEAGFSAVKNVTYTQDLSSVLSVDRKGLVSKVFGNMRVFTVDGKCIREGKVNEGQFIPLSAGLYVILIDNANLQMTGKVVL